MGSLVDSLIEYASKRGEIDSSLPRLRDLDKTTLSAGQAAVLFARFKAAADNGSAFAMCICARLCRDGIGEQPAQSAAIEWARRAVAADYAPGHYELALCYERGIGTPPDPAHAELHYRSAAEAGYPFAAYRLGLLFHDRDFGLARDWMDRAIAGGEGMAAVDLAFWFEHGDGVAQDLAVARSYFEVAASMNEPAAMLRLSSAWRGGELGFTPSALQADLWARKAQDVFKGAG